MDKKGLLIIEDDEETRNNWQEFFARETNLRVLAADSGEDALDLLKKNDIDIFLIDIILKGKMNGIDFVSKIRNEGNKKPVILISGYLPEYTPSYKSIQGLDIFCSVSKPVSMNVVRRKIFQALNNTGGFVYLATPDEEKRKESDLLTLRSLLPIDSTGRFMESLAFNMPERAVEQNIICISSQSGCQMGCRFCATGSEVSKNVQNLSVDEMKKQIKQARRDAGFSDPVLVLLMGMGEPSLNVKNVVRLIREDDRHRFEISSIGLVKNLGRMLKELGKEPVLNALQLSIHFPDDALRQKHMPFGRNNLIKDILDVAEKYHNQTGTNIWLNYTLFFNINDSHELVQKFMRLVKGRPFGIKLSEANEYEMYSKASPERFREIQEIFGENEIRFKVMISRGKGYSGCGQMTARIR